MKEFIDYWPMWLLLIIILVFAGISAHDTDVKASECRAKGGVPLFDRAVFSACVKKENFIDVEDSNEVRPRN